MTDSQGAGTRGMGVKALRLEEFLQLPETEPASEFQDGRIIQKVSPQGKHSLLQIDLATRLNSVARPARSGVAFSELRFTFSGRSIVPDVSFVAWERIPRDPSGEIADHFFLPPDLAVEIISPDQEISDLVEKLSFCVQNGTRLGWLIDPAKKRVTVFRPDRSPESLETGTLSAEPVLPGVAFTVEEVFGWLILPR